DGRPSTSAREPRPSLYRQAARHQKRFWRHGIPAPDAGRNSVLYVRFWSHPSGCMTFQLRNLLYHSWIGSYAVPWGAFVMPIWEIRAKDERAPLRGRYLG